MDNRREKVKLSIVIPCYNEEKNIIDTVNSIYEANNDFSYELELLIVDDGSHDNTFQVIKKLEAENNNIKALRFIENKGLGIAYTTAMILATGTHFMLVPGDNQISISYLKALYREIGNKDVILSYPENNHIRPFTRRLYSATFVKIYNLLFGLKLKYYNGPAIFDLKKLMILDLPTRFFSYHAEMVVKFAKKGWSYKEVGGELKERKFGRSSAVSWLNLLGLFFGTLLLFFDIYYMKSYLYKKGK